MDYKDFKNIVDNLHDEIMVFDDDYNMIYVNKAAERHYGVKAEELIGKKFEDLDDHYWGNSTLPEVYRTKKMVVRRQITNLGHDIITISTPILDDKGGIEYVAQNVNDMYQINRMNLIETKPIQIESDSKDVDKPYFGNDWKMRRNLEMIDKIKDIDSPCFISGETGTGKNVLANYIHSVGNRSDRPLVTINCACINPNIMESELFGYKKGAFSGANMNGKKGMVEIADGGILFMDEISEIDYDLQAKLLYFIQYKKFIPVGGEKEQEVDVRIITASNRDLKQMVESNSFRADLYFRLNTFELKVPPLRERKEDISGFMDYYLELFNKKYNKEHTISKGVYDMMEKYSWPGNLRELSNIMEKTVVLSKEKNISINDLPKYMFELKDQRPAEHDNTGEKGIDSGGAFDVEKNYNLNDALKSVERKMITDAYRICGSSIKAAKMLGISQSKAYRLMMEHIPEYRRQTLQQQKK